jgi:hypothetical protein
LNLDADLELGGQARAYDAFTALERRPELFEALGALVPAEDSLLTRAGPAPFGVVARGVSSPSSVHELHEAAFVGLAWCPTPSALRTLTAAGASVGRAPSLELLRQVNHRRWSAALGQTLEGACFVTTADDALDALAHPSGSGAWLIKRAFGFAGRGRNVLRGALRDSDLAFIAHGVAEGGLQIEPLVDRIVDVAVHGYVRDAHGFTLGEPTIQTMRGATWAGSRRAGPSELTPAEEDALESEAKRVAAALAAEGYVGPFGVDGFRYRWGSETRFQPRSEVNARYTMGFGVGMGDCRPDLEVGGGSGLRPGKMREFSA